MMSDVTSTGNNGSINGSCITNSSSLSPSSYVTASINASSVTSACSVNSSNTSCSNDNNTIVIDNATESTYNSNNSAVHVNSSFASGGDAVEVSTKINDIELNTSTGPNVSKQVRQQAVETTVTNVSSVTDRVMDDDTGVDVLSTASSSSAKVVSGAGVATFTPSTGHVEQTASHPSDEKATPVENSVGVSCIIPSTTTALSGSIPINGVKTELFSLNSTVSQPLPSTVELTLGSVVASVVSSKLGSVKEDAQHFKEEINTR